MQALYRRILNSVMIEGSYMILLAHDTYDVPFRSRDGERMEDASTDVFSYILCAICPVKLTKPALSYYVYENEFHSLQTDWIVSSPEIGFMFPAFDDRCSNIYGALYYTRDITKNQSDFVDALFRAPLPMPAAAQKDAFEAILGEALAEDCSCEVVQAVHEHLCERIEEHKANHEEEPLVVTKEEVKTVLDACGVRRRAWRRSGVSTTRSSAKRRRSARAILWIRRSSKCARRRRDPGEPGARRSGGDARH